MNNIQKDTELRFYQNKLLTALNVSPTVQAKLSKDILDSAYVIYEMQKIYASAPEGDKKNQLALAIAEGSRILLSEINKISISKPIPSVPSKKSYEVGDMFRAKEDTEEIPTVIFRIDSITNTSISIEGYVLSGKISRNPTTIEGYGIQKFDDLLNSGEWIAFDYTKIVNVGDIFKVVKDPLDPPEVTKEVTNIEKAKNEIIYDLKDAKNPSINVYGKKESIIYFISTISDKLFEKYIPTQNVFTPPTPPTPTAPKPQKPPTPPKPQKPKTQKPKTTIPPPPPPPPQIAQLSCKEIKEAIKGLTLLAKLGDDESIQTIKTLKDTLKTQNCN